MSCSRQVEKVWPEGGGQVSADGGGAGEEEEEAPPLRNAPQVLGSVKVSR